MSHRSCGHGRRYHVVFLTVVWLWFIGTSTITTTNGFSIPSRFVNKIRSAGKISAASANGDEQEDGKTKKITVASQVESIVENAKQLNPFGKRKLDGGKIWQSLASGLAVSLAMVPEAISFAFVAGVNPLVGLWTTVTLGFVAAALGGRAGICSSASGACAVVVAALGASHGPTYLSACAILAGILQVVFGGVLNMGKFIRLVPHPVMLGFVNGLTVVMARAQMTHFKHAGTWLSIQSAMGKATYGLTALTVLLVRVILPKIIPSLPPSLGAVVLTSLLAKYAKLPVQTLADAAGAETFRGGLNVLPKFLGAFPPFNMETFKIILPYAITMAAVGCIESLLTMQLLDGIMDDGKRGSTKKECTGQGLGNVASGLFGGIGGCALLGQSIINVQSGGGVSRLSGMSMSLFLALGVVAFAPLLAAVPIASLVGVMLVVCSSTFSWSSLRILHKIPKLDAAVIALVSYITVKDDLAKAVVAGVSASALGFAWNQSTTLSATTKFIPRPFADIDAAGLESDETKWKVYKLKGPLFFGSTRSFQQLFTVKDDPKNIVLDFTNTRVMDHSALESMTELSKKYFNMGKIVHFQHLSKDCASLLQRLHDDNDKNENSSYNFVIESDPTTDPVYGLAEDYNGVTMKK